ncbi:MAG: cupin protein [Patescibacteria group bacterium]|nr:cupin protein [Patescibacteria group bacterium]
MPNTNFSTESYVKRIEKPWGYELHLAPPASPYTAKIMHINAGTRQSLQVHDEKTETYLIMKGRANVLIEDSEGKMIEIELKPETGYTTKVGQKHRLIGVTDCDIAEFSTPETGTTWRLEDDYSRPDETEELRNSPGRGWKA